MNLKKGTNLHKIYNILLTHEFMKKSTLARKTGIPSATLSSCLTKLRRCGLIEHSGGLGGQAGSDIAWKKHPIDKPLYPAQPDLIKRKNSKSHETPKVTVAMRIEHASKLILELTAEMEALEKAYDEVSGIFIESGVTFENEMLYKKKESKYFNTKGGKKDKNYD